MSVEVPRRVRAIDWDRWEPVDRATLLFVIREGRVLLIRKKRGLGAGKINGPGGRIEAGESPGECAVRELQEELCITPLDPRQLGEHRFQFTDGYSMHVHVFVSSDFVGEPTETDEAIPLWCSVDAVPYDEMWADDRHWVPLMLRGHSFTGRYVFDGDAMLDFELTDGGPADA